VTDRGLTEGEGFAEDAFDKGGKMRPLIGITCSRLVGGSWGLYSRGHFMDYTFAEYSEAVLALGGAPVLIPVAQSAESIAMILGALGGLILTGGPDVNPRFYGEQPLEGLGDVDEGLDLMELEVARAAVNRDIPTLAICRGIQVLNVAQKGTLYQDVGSQVADAINHGQKADKGVLTHMIRIAPESRLSRIMESDEIWVNSKHHQAVKAPGTGLAITARASDGVIEALENPGRRFVLGVQWHPEGTWQHDPSSRKLFEALIRATGG
jgi:putative glutamine amidotransferase